MIVFLSGKIKDPIINNKALKTTLNNPIFYPGTDIPNNVCIGASPIIAVKPPNNDRIAPKELAFSQYKPPINNDIAPVKYTAPVIAI